MSETLKPKSISKNFNDVRNMSSKDLNELIEEMMNDIVSAYSKLRKNDKTINENTKIINHQGVFLDKKIKSLENQIIGLEETLDNKINNQNSYVKVKSFYETDLINPVNVQLNNSYGFLSIDYDDLQFKNLDKYDDRFLRENLAIEVSIFQKDAEGNLLSPKVTISNYDDNDLHKILDKDDATLWHKEIITDNSVNHIEFEVKVNIPPKLSPSLLVNAIGIKPHIAYSMDIMDLKYEDANTGTYKRFHNYPMDGDVPKVINESSNYKVTNDKKVEARNIVIKLKQKNYMQSGNNRVFTIGLRGLDVENIETNANEMSFITKLKAPGENSYFTRILKPKLQTINEEILPEESVNFDLIYDLKTMSSFEFGNQDAQNNEVYIKTTIKDQSGSTPFIKSIKHEFNISKQ